MRQERNQINRTAGIRGGELKYLALLSLTVLAYLVVGLWLRQIRWINPDEGAHIADAVLLLDGKIPVVDYPSRQPLYVLFLATDIFFMGSTLTAARVAPLVATILTGVLVYFFIRLRFEPSYALAGSLGYLLIPLNITFATVVKMEPFALLLGTGAALCCIAAMTRNRPAAWLFASGLLITGCFYVRESTAYALLFASVVTLVLFRPEKYASRVVGPIWMCAGAICGFLLAFGLFARHMGLAAYLNSSLFPLDILVRTTERLSSLALRSQPADQTFAAIRLLIYSHTFLIFAGLLGIGSCLLSSVRSRYRTDISVFCGLWLGGLLIVYLLRGITAALFPSYGREFTVPAIVLTVAGVRWLWRDLKPHLGRAPFPSSLIAATVALQLVIVAGQLAALEEPRFVFFTSLLLLIAFLRLILTAGEGINTPSSPSSRFWFYVVGILCAGLVVRAVMSLAKPIVGSEAYFFLTLAALAGITVLALRQTHLPLGATGRTTGLILLVAVTMYSLSNARAILDRKFDCVWSPAQLSKVALHLVKRVPKGGSVLSGANIWAIEAERKVFGDVTHPLGLIIPPEYLVLPHGRIGDLLRESPPNAIILDGYTEKTYGSQWDLAGLIKDRYSAGENVTIEGESRYPVIIYVRNDVARVEIPSPGDVDTL